MILLFMIYNREFKIKEKIMFELHMLTKILLMSCNEMVLVPIIIFGFLALDRKIFGHATILLMFIMILNSFLKSIFQVPLSEHLNVSGYAFPSGHMSSTLTFYGWLFFSTQNNFIRFLLAMLVAGVGFSLIYKGYHNIYDIAGSVFFCTILLALYTWLSKTKHASDKPFLLGYVMGAFSAGIMWYFNSYSTIPNHVWMAAMVLAGFTVSWSFFAHSIKSNPSLLSALIGFLCIFGVYFLSLKIKIMINMPYDFQWALVGILIPLAAKLTSGASLQK
jgi:hypothetical protein